ncbi:putative PEP-binding protein [Haloquadratum walsbyi]|jgi:phosphoenolpyruvate synthase (EC 2.7.9.2)|uniref:Phosphoenolpyruvate synthase/pyruvate phosphate dikinase n=1 Tax=Haloquadratum walsbyi J07HQW2 TaxID=1238425 RepID=U1MW84_9EURY|nr:MAG: phosphoenolpyruvate synthase/pyruvate phosphate dikinase [Haloquadratum walsbyi J07HQW2]
MTQKKTEAISEETESEHNPEPGTELARGYGASPGVATGPARVIKDIDDAGQITEGDVIVTEMTAPDMVPAMQRSTGIITDNGGMTSHAAIVSRELGVPAIVGCGDATEALSDGQRVTLDGEKGTVVIGEPKSESESTLDSESTPERTAETDRTNGSIDDSAEYVPTTATEVKVNVSIPGAAQRAADTNADGVGLLRLEHILLSTGKTPDQYVADHGEEAFVKEISEEIRKVADAFYPRPVRARTLDAPTDELAELEGGESEPIEHNPMLGYRGIRRSLQEPEMVKLELRAFKRLHDMGYDNLEVMFPLPNDAEDVRRARELMDKVGIDRDAYDWGAMIETPASIRSIDEIIDEGVDFVALGTNDIVQFMLAVDRNNAMVADRFDNYHPTILEAMAEVIEACNEHDVDTTITGQSGSDPEMAKFLAEQGISSLSSNIDAVDDVRRVVARAEQELLLNAARDASDDSTLLE